MRFKKFSLNILLNKPFTELEKFHSKTKFKKWLPAIEVKYWPESWKTTYFKEYPRLDKIILSPPSNLKGIKLEDALMQRNSSRNFSKQKMTLENLSNFLYFSAGLRDNFPPWIANRTYPSPGGRYTLEVYLLSLNSELPKGVFHYNVRSHTLEVLDLIKDIKTNDYFNQDWISKASCIIVVTAIFARNTIKYGDRGYRHILEEAGHLGQNFYLNSIPLKLSVCGIGGYVDDRINRLLDVDGIKETVIYVLAVGKK